MTKNVSKYFQKLLWKIVYFQIEVKYMTIEKPP